MRRECVTPPMTAFVTLAGVYSTTDFVVERSRLDQGAMTSRALDQFLTSVEKRAFKIAQLGLRNDDDALDAVQDAMMKLVQSYASRPADEWRPLFYRILANQVRDMQRRRTVRGRIMAWLPLGDAEDDDEYDPIAQAPSHEPTPAKRLELDEKAAASAMDSTEANRDRYVQKWHSRKRQDAANYHLAVNTGFLGYEGAAELVVSAARQRGWGDT